MMETYSWNKRSENQLSDSNYLEEDFRVQSQMNDCEQQVLIRKGSQMCHRNTLQNRQNCRTPSQTKRTEQGPLRNNLRNILRSNFQDQAKKQVESQYDNLREEFSELQFVEDDETKVQKPRPMKIKVYDQQNTKAYDKKSSVKSSTQQQQKRALPLRSNLRNILKSNFQESKCKENVTQEQIEVESKKDKIRKEITELQFIAPEFQSLDQYAIGKSLGVGSTAEVKMAKHKILDLIVAIKIYDKKKMSSQCQKNLQREIEILSKVHHPNVIRLYHALDGEKNINLVMEYTSPTCLNSFMRGRPFKRINEDDARIIFRQIVDAVCYIHHQNILHRDMKLENVLIDYNSRKIKLIDFGYSVEIDPNSQIYTSCGTPSYMSPEIVRRQNYSFGADVWSCGVILFKILTGVFPFRGNSEKDLFKKIAIGRLEFPSFLSAGSKNILLQMLRVDQHERPSIFQIVEHPWFDG